MNLLLLQSALSTDTTFQVPHLRALLLGAKVGDPLLTTDTPAILALCIAMTVALLWYVFYLPDNVSAAPEKTRLAFLRERKETLYENLRDLNFEYKAGKFPESDYLQMRASLEDEAAALLAEIERLESLPASSAPFASSVPSASKGFSRNAKPETRNESQKGSLS
jgi:hypothetical protein